MYFERQFCCQNKLKLSKSQSVLVNCDHSPSSPMQLLIFDNASLLCSQLPGHLQKHNCSGRLIYIGRFHKNTNNVEHPTWAVPAQHSFKGCLKHLCTCVHTKASISVESAGHFSLRQTVFINLLYKLIF